LDKTSKKLLAGLAANLDEVTEISVDHQLSKVSFLDCAPGLRELLNISADFWEETSILPKRPIRCTRPKKMASVAETSSDETSDESVVEASETESENEEMDGKKYFEEE
jgi:hypothetical protein